MKVLMLNGSPRPHGNTFDALSEIGRQLEAEGVEYEIYQIGAKPVLDCIACRNCTEEGCVFPDNGVNDFIAKAKECDGFIFGTPVYYAHPTGSVLSFLDRVFFAGGDAFKYKPGAAIAVARRGGTTASFDCMNKYFGISEMPIPGSSYWNIVHGRDLGEAVEDLEGMQTMRNLAKNMAWMIKCFDVAKKYGIDYPDADYSQVTNFIR